jgi:peptidylprolyl isomerase
MAQAAAGDTVHIHYTGRLDNGTIFDASEGRAPLAFELGAGHVIPGFDRAVLGMVVGEEKEVRIEVAEAYGAKRDDLLFRIPLAQLPEGLEAPIGAQLQMSGQQGGQFPVQVVASDDEAITVDANHPLAGEALTFALKLVAIGGGAVQ